MSLGWQLPSIEFGGYGLTKWQWWWTSKSSASNWEGKTTQFVRKWVIYSVSNNIHASISHNIIQICNNVHGLTLLCGIFLTLNMNVGNNLQSTVNLTKHCYGFEQCYALICVCFFLFYTTYISWSFHVAITQGLTTAFSLDLKVTKYRCPIKESDHIRLT